MKTTNIVILIALITLFAVAGMWVFIRGGDFLGIGPGNLQFQKGMSYVTWGSDRYEKPGSDEALEALANTGTKWVTIVVTWYQDHCASTEIFPRKKTPTDESLIHAINEIHSLGMKVMLKPHLDLLDEAGGAWRGEIYCGNEDDWHAWFASYADFIQYYAALAQEYGVDIYCIGVELSSVSGIHRDRWKKMVIDPVRKIYSGALTYAANWDGEYKKVVFWDLLDYVGVDAYFPLSEEEDPTLEQIKGGWNRWVRELEDFQSKVNKPIVFTEVGYCSAPGAARKPWEEIVFGTPDMRIQADCYRALFETFWEKPWFYGVYWWRWGTDVRSGGMTNKSFPPQNKPAEDVLREWYRKATPSKNPSIFKKE